MKEGDILFLCDFETTGVSPKDDYPIELGGLFLDKNLDIIDKLELLILPHESCFTVTEDKELVWKSRYKEAYNVHKIEPKELVEKGVYPEVAVERILSKIKDLKPKGRVIILSDNAQFEFNFMKRLFELAEREEDFPFHYSAWDTNLLLELYAPEIGDPVPVHRALPDALRLYKQLIRISEKIGYFG